MRKHRMAAGVTRCQHKTNFRGVTAINTAQIPPARIVKGSFVTNPGVPHKTLTFFTHIKPFQNPIC
ncbi:MAG TPA: hypothetical protein VFE27_19695 [Acidobacteriaceae bacterium]|nr:hypothetical protein [Acidobacteriaceae bacterium]